MVGRLVSTCMLMNVRVGEGWFANGGRPPYGKHRPFLRWYPLGLVCARKLTLRQFL